MSGNLRDPKAADPKDRATPGLDPEELRAEQADDLPDRDAMSIISVGGLEGGLPPAGILDGIVGSDEPVDTLPIDGLPVERYPVDELPIQIMPPDIQPPVIEPPVIEPPIADTPLDPPADTLPVEPPVDGDPVSVPDPLDATLDAKVDV